MGHHTLRRITNLAFAFILTVASVNLGGLLSVTSAYASTGNNGTLKVHEIGTASGTESNDPKVCAFNFEGFSFDSNQSGYIVVETQPGGTSSLVPSPMAFGPTDNTGYAISSDVNNGGAYTLANGHYKATLYGKDTGNPANPDLKDVKAKSKVFKVDCSDDEDEDQPVVAGDPTPTDDCGTANDGYTIVATNGVTYVVDNQEVTAGFHSATGTVTIDAVANDGYVLDGTPNTWTFDFSDEACETPVTPVTPTDPQFVDLCGEESNYFVIPNIEGVSYYDGQTLLTSGKHFSDVPVTVTAVANQGYSFGDHTYSWQHDFNFIQCDPGKGDFNPPVDPPVTPQTPAVPTGVTLPETGSNPLSQLISVIVAGILTYGVTFFLVNRRDLAQK